MKRHWDDAELSREWSLSHAEFEQLKNRTAKTKLAFAALLKFFLLEGRFPKEKREVPSVALEYLAEQLDVDVRAFDGYDLNSRTAKRDREVIRDQLGFRRFTVEDSHTLAAWLCDNEGVIRPALIETATSQHIRKMRFDYVPIYGV